MAVTDLKKRIDKELKYYLKNGLWNHFESEELFGLVLDNGETVYINFINDIEGTEGSFLIFKDLEALGTCIHLFDIRDYTELKYANEYDFQDALAFTPFWSDLDHSKKPEYNLLDFEPGMKPVPVENEQDLELILNVLKEFKKYMGLIKRNDRSLNYIQLNPAINGKGLLPVFRFENNKVKTVRKIVLNYEKKKIPKVRFNNDLLELALKRLFHYGEWVLEIMYTEGGITMPEKNPGPEKKNCIYLESIDDGYSEFAQIDVSHLKDPKGFVNAFARELLDFDKLPDTVYIRDEKTFNLLEDFLKKINIDVVRKDSIPELEKLEQEILDEYSYEEMTDEGWIDLEEIVNPLNDKMDEISTLIEISGLYIDNPYFRRIKKKLEALQEGISEMKDSDLNDDE